MVPLIRQILALMYSVLVIFVVVGGVVLAGGTTTAKFGIAPDPVKVILAEIQKIGRVSKDQCSIQKPCAGLEYGSRLKATLTRAGYASAFLQDQGGNFFNQQGSMFIINSVEGDTGLWPGTPDGVGHTVFKLWLVISERPIKTTPDSEPLKTLPEATNGEVWGPLYFEVAQRSEGFKFLNLTVPYTLLWLIIPLVFLVVLGVGYFLYKFLHKAFQEGREISFWPPRIGERRSNDKNLPVGRHENDAGPAQGGGVASQPGGQRPLDGS